MKKFKLFSFILVLSILGVLPALATDQTITLDYSSFSLTTSYAQKTATVGGFGFTVNQGYKGSGNVIQMNSSKGSGTLYNTSAISGLKSIKVNVSSGNKTYTITTGTSQNPTANSQTGTTGGTYNAATGDTYFQLKVSGASYFSSIEITYDDGQGGGSTTTTCATPTFSPEPGSYEGTQNVTISSTTGATIYYTTDGTTPTTSSSVYSTPIPVSADMTIKAYATLSGYDDSELATAAYSITEGPDVILNLVDGNWGFPSANSTSLSTYTNSETGYSVQCYAADAYKAVGGSSAYFIIGKANSYMLLPKFDNVVEKIIVVGNSGGSGKVTFNIFDDDVAVSTAVTGCTSDQTFVINNPEPEKRYAIKVTNANNLQMKQIKIYYGETPAVAKPIITGTDNFFTTSEISITCGTAGNTIYYTTDGTDPKTSSTKQTYSAPFTINATATIKAIAKVGNDWSSANEKTFTKLETWTVAEANEQLALSSPINNKYVRGIVSQVDAFASNAITYWISDDGSTSNQLEVYKGKGLDGANFSAITDLKVGDIVVVYGNLKVYTPSSGPSVNEFDNGNYLVLKEDPAVATPIFTPDGGGFVVSTSVTITCSTANSTIYYTTNGDNPTTSSSEYNAAIPLSATTTIKAIAYVGNEHSIVVTKTFTLSAPKTVAEAYDELVSADLPDVAVQGKVYKVDGISSGSATYWISDDGTETEKVLEVYKGKGLNHAELADGDIQEGDEVIVFGTLTIYNSTKEFAQGSRLLSFNRPITAVTNVTMSGTATVKVGKTKTLTATVVPSNATNKTINWSITSGEAFASIDENGVVTGIAEGTAVIRAASAENANIYAECTVSVIEGVPFATGDWLLVTDAAELTAGSYVIIAAADYGKAMKPYDTGNNCKAEDATKDGSMLEYNSAFGIFEIGDYEIEEVLYKTFQSEDDEKYLFLGSNDNHLKAQTAKNANAAWTITSVSNAGVAVITSKSFNTRTMRFNDNSNLFACYASGQKDIALYKYYAPVPKVIYNKNTDDEVTNMPGATRAELEGNVYKATISTTVPQRSGYEFVGWINGETSYVAGEKYTIDADITIYAQWSALSPHHITYNTSGSTGETPVDATDYYLGDEVTLASASGLSNAGYFFDGWRVTYVDGESAVQTVTVEEGKFIMPNYDVTATATWAPKSDDKWLLVTGTDMLEQNGEYVIVSAEADNNKYYAMSKIQNTNNRGVAEVELNGDNLVGSSSMAIFTLKTGTENNSWAFYDPANTGYIYAASSSKNYLQTQDENDANGSWIIEFGEESVATITAQGGNTHNILKYNSGSDIFSCYTTGQQAVKLYKKKAVVRVEDAETTKTSEIAAGADVIIEDGGTLTVDDAKSLNDLTVKEGGAVRLSNDLTVVGTFIIKSVMGSGKSGQLVGATTSNFTASDDAYIDITLGANGTNQQWHAFTVPFPVDVLNGIYDLADNKLTNEVNYAIMEYFGDIRATGAYGWKKIRTTLVPGTFYIMATDGHRTTYRFKKKAGAAIVAANSKEIKQYAKSGDGTDTDAGWNGVGNPTLTYGKVAYEVQVLDPESYTFVKKDANSTNFVVGTPFFYQAAADGSISMLTADAGANYVPARTSANEIEKIKVAFGNEDYTDYLDISASEDATNEYQISKDLVKMTMTNTPKVAQIFGVAYNTKLCMVNAPLHNDQAKYSLNLYVPEDGEYTITVPDCDIADIYLTYDGHIIWNIAAGPYTGDFQQGDNKGYGLILRRKPQVTTGVENSRLLNDANGVQKIILNDHVYILRGEQLYDVTGKMVR